MNRQPTPLDLQKYPADAWYIELWGNPFEVLENISEGISLKFLEELPASIKGNYVPCCPQLSDGRAGLFYLTQVHKFLFSIDLWRNRLKTPIFLVFTYS